MNYTCAWNTDVIFAYKLIYVVYIVLLFTVSNDNCWAGQKLYGSFSAWILEEVSLHEYIICLIICQSPLNNF